MNRIFPKPLSLQVPAVKLWGWDSLGEWNCISPNFQIPQKMIERHMSPATGRRGEACSILCPVIESKFSEKTNGAIRDNELDFFCISFTHHVFFESWFIQHACWHAIFLAWLSERNISWHHSPSVASESRVIFEPWLVGCFQPFWKISITLDHFPKFSGWK